MRNFILSLIVFSFMGCLEEKYIDKRPSDQVNFLTAARQWRDSVNTNTTPAMRQKYLEKGVSEVKTHIIDSLQLRFESWEARILDIGPDPTDKDYTITSFGMNLDGGLPNEKTRYQSVVFTSRTVKSEPVDATIKTLQIGDLVRISGNYKMLLKTINVDSYNDLSKSNNVLDNPEFRIELSKLEKL
ncbi:MAG TPA: hypothetical protein VNI52_08040 [Sphingobacteriaceae bacterium]|nr:hypothetical protein [Sphingobacteriaceae bacterium]